MRIGSRRSFSSPSDSGPSFDPDAEAYFAAAGITNLAEKIAANDFIVTAKANGFWNSLERIYLVSPTSESAALVCCSSLTSMTNVNSVSWSTNGFQPNYVDNYLDTNFDQGDSFLVSPLSVSIGSSLKSVTWRNTSGSIAAISGSIEPMNTKPMWCYTSDNSNVNTTYIRVGPSNMQTASDVLLGKTFTHMVTNNVITTALIFPSSYSIRFNLFINGAEEAFGTTTTGLIADNLEDVFFGAVNIEGSPFYTTTGPPTVLPTFNFMFIGVGLTAAQVNNIYNAMLDYNTALGRA